MESKFVGKAWSTNYEGMRISLKREDLLTLPVNQYGDILLYVGKRKEIDPKSKATHFVKYNPPEDQKSSQSTSILTADDWSGLIE